MIMVQNKANREKYRRGYRKRRGRTPKVLSVMMLLVAVAYSLVRFDVVPIPAAIQSSDFTEHLGKAEKISVHMIDVGEGLSLLIDNGQTEVLIDGGYAQYGQKVSDYVKNSVDGELDYVIATHSHADHVGGLTQVIDDYDVNHVIYGDRGKSNQFRDFESAALNEPGAEYVNREDETIPLGSGMNMEIIDVFDDDENTNNNSIITLFNMGEKKMLVTGDAESNVERQLLGKIGKVDILIVGHHGSETSSSQALLDEINPEYGLISSAGPDYQYNNPDGDVMRRLTDAGTKLYGTYVSGNIIAGINGNNIVLSPPGEQTLTYENYRSLK